jgi:hypothetical protein
MGIGKSSDPSCHCLGLFKRVRGIFRLLSWPIPVASESALRLELTNGSRVVSLPGKEGTIRGLAR